MHNTDTSMLSVCACACVHCRQALHACEAYTLGLRLGGDGEGKGISLETSHINPHVLAPDKWQKLVFERKTWKKPKRRCQWLLILVILFGRFNVGWVTWQKVDKLNYFKVGHGLYLSTPKTNGEYVRLWALR